VNDIPVSTLASFHLAPRKCIVSGNNLPEGLLQRSMTLCGTIAIPLQEMAKPDVQKRSQGLDPEIRQSQRPILIMTAGAKLPAFWQAKDKKYAF
jgi:hypothetical protein